MEHTTTNTEITYHHEPSDSTKRIWKTFWILLVITILELTLGLLTYTTDFAPWVHMTMKGAIIILSLAKAFYIVSIFMHLGDEIRNMVMTVVVPLLLFIWFISAFLWDGNAFRHARNRYDKYFEQSTLERPVSTSDTATKFLQ